MSETSGNSSDRYRIGSCYVFNAKDGSMPYGRVNANFSGCTGINE